MRQTVPFRRRLFAAFLIVSLIPLLICSAMLLQIFRLRLVREAQREMEEQLHAVSLSMDTAFSALREAAEALRGDPLLAQALTGGVEDTAVYKALFDAAEPARSYAGFDLYDLTGLWRYSTWQTPRESRLPTDWGVLSAAAAAGEPLRFTACADVTDTASPLLQCAVLLTDDAGQPAGYALVSLYQSHLRTLLEGKYGAQNDLLLLSRYWRPVYCVQPALAASLTPVLRSRLLAGEALSSGADPFLYAVSRHETSGLYLVLQRPQVFTEETMRLLYTVSLTCAVCCIAVSVGMSFKLSRQLSRPIERLHQGFGAVERNDLSVQVSAEGRDELGSLAARFNGMVAALRQNQEALVENQRELNAAQIRMLQAQLNPHFLCNTLDTMKWISKINKVPEVALMSTDLADILRFGISPEEFVPLRRETEILQRYIEIQKIRMSDAFTFSLSVPEALLDCLIPKMILQPLVENAILHGLEGVSAGTITVEARQEGEMLRITVEDNGRGLPEDMDLSPGREHLGLYNVDTILRKHYGGGAGLELRNRAGGGAAVTAVLPVRREEEEGC